MKCNALSKPALSTLLAALLLAIGYGMPVQAAEESPARPKAQVGVQAEADEPDADGGEGSKNIRGAQAAPRRGSGLLQHELTHTTQQRAGSSSSRQGAPLQQGGVIVDTDFNDSPDDARQPPPASAVQDGTSNTVLVGESQPAPPPPPASAVQDGTSNTVLVSESRPAPPPSATRPSPSNPFIPEVDDEVLVALESGTFSVSGKYVIVSVRHRQPVRLPAGTYRSKSGRVFSIADGRFIAGE